MIDPTLIIVGVAAAAFLGGAAWLLRPKKTIVEPETKAAAPVKAPEAPRPIFSRIHESFSSKLETLLQGTKQFDEKFADDLEELLYTADVGPKTVERLLNVVKEKLTRGELKDLRTVKKALFDEMNLILLKAQHPSQASGQPHVILIVGVNGVGKTTSIGKLAHFLSSQGKSVMVVAGDTFRAAASDQLAVWGERAQVEVYTSERTKDPSAIAYEGVQKALADKKDIVIVDTAGRLHTKENLMDELKKVKRVIDKALPGAPHEIILVVDGNSGQNALVQAREFNQALGLTGLVVTKLDGTARGGVILGIAEELDLGVRYVGVGEKLGDIRPFQSEEYLKGLLRL